MIIVIDGPSGSGKSTLAKKLSKQLHIPYFDTGAMYRSCCWFLLNEKVDLDNAKAVEHALDNFHFEIKKVDGELKYFVNNQDISLSIRDEEVTQHVSKVASYLFVRQKLVPIQREFGKNSDGIFEGRDMGTYVFPDADVKFFLYADPNIRALRRFEELKLNFPLKTFEKDKVLLDLMKRDEYDSRREHSPLKQAKDAFLIDVSYLTIDEVFEKMESYIKEKSL